MEWLALGIFAVVVWVAGNIVADRAHHRNVAMRDTIWGRDRIKEVVEQYPFHRDRGHG